MPVKIRLTRRGRKKLALFDIIISDSKSSRDGKFIEKIGIYNPNTNPATIEINEQKAFDWIMKGAQPTDTVKAMLSYKGIMFQKHLQLGVLKGAITQEDADNKLNAWKESKIGKVENKKSRLASDKDKVNKQKLEAETKVNAAREEALKIKNKVIETPIPTIEASPAAEVEKIEDASPSPQIEVITNDVPVENVVTEPQAVEVPSTEAKEQNTSVFEPALETKAEELHPVESSNAENHEVVTPATQDVENIKSESQDELPAVSEVKNEPTIETEGA